MECIEPISSNFGGIDFTGFPSNCALGIINTSLPPVTIGDEDTASIVCVACKPGYKATYYDDSTKYKITACEIISECRSKRRTVNGCDD